jgi:histidinol phosphatase-like enzyme
VSVPGRRRRRKKKPDAIMKKSMSVEICFGKEYFIGDEKIDITASRSVPIISPLILTSSH